ncbi:hypothetical protein FB565_002499 [Actinoplanes lutulentus]|uniref:DUF456 domain-containing protein n=1 Tax=Actinoplanes lutulentus TaxID=1287878 RepID=A0A327ZD99_9ACTN|nr:DUF456 domain-containing protein [Actinoplanes lutulentus]MBB2942786.1 hypothetical protein [Actinoplanes lutulentus]RAK38366.1 hypothetical protein B0I29_105314 [Actinoplanes lutulentus]
MDLSDTGSTVNILAGLLIAIGAIGVMLPVIPGLLLSWSGVLLWALLGSGSGGVRWTVLGVATLIAGAGLVIKFLWPGKKLRNTVPNSALLAGGVLGLIGFFVVPVVGLVLGFVLGIWLVEVNRLGSERAWPSTRSAIAAVGLSLLVEFAAALGIAVVWVVGLILS